MSRLAADAPLCNGCARCALAPGWLDAGEQVGGAAEPSGPEDAPVLVVGEAPGKEEARLGGPFLGKSGRLIRATLKAVGIDPETEVRWVNVVQCRPPKNRAPEPLEIAACSVLAHELANTKARVIIAAGRVAADRLLGAELTKTVQSSRATWDGYAYPRDMWPDRIDLGYELYEDPEIVFKSGARKGQPKPQKRLLSAPVQISETVRAIVPVLHPSAIARSGFSNVVQFRVALHHAVQVAKGATIFDGESLMERVITDPTKWLLPAHDGMLDLAVDIENTDLGITRIGFAAFDHHGVAQLASLPWTPATQALAAKLLGDASPYETIFAHNGAYDFGQLLAFDGIKVRGASEGERGKRLFCTMLGAQIDQPDLPKGLGAMWRYMPGPMRPWKHLSKASPVLYNAIDVYVCAIAGAQIRRRLTTAGQRSLVQSVMATMMVLDRMSRNGLQLDREWATAEKARREARRDELKQRWLDATGLSVIQGPQIATLFYEKLGLVPRRFTEKRGDPSTSEEALLEAAEAHGDPAILELVNVLVGIRGEQKAIATYLEGFLEAADPDDVLHPSYLPNIKDSGDLGTAAGRLSSSPNVQNVSEDLRYIVKPPQDGWVIGDSDLSAVEGRVQAALAGDTELLEMYDRVGFDMHTYNLEAARAALREHWEHEVVEYKGKPRARHAKAMLADAERGTWPITRKSMKTFLYGRNYGAGDPKIADSLGIPVREAAIIGKSYDALHPATAQWRRAVVEEARARKLLQNPFGRIRYFQGIVPDVHVQNAAINFLPQSTVADMFWIWFPEVEEMLRDYGGRLVTQVHDSFVWTAPQVSAQSIATQLDAIMGREWPQIAPGFRVPVKTAIGPSWGHCKG